MNADDCVERLHSVVKLLKDQERDAQRLLEEEQRSSQTTMLKALAIRAQLLQLHKDNPRLPQESTDGPATNQEISPPSPQQPASHSEPPSHSQTKSVSPLSQLSDPSREARLEALKRQLAQEKGINYTPSSSPCSSDSESSISQQDCTELPSAGPHATELAKELDDPTKLADRAPQDERCRTPPNLTPAHEGGGTEILEEQLCESDEQHAQKHQNVQSQYQDLSAPELVSRLLGDASAEQPDMLCSVELICTALSQYRSEIHAFAKAEEESCNIMLNDAEQKCRQALTDACEVHFSNFREKLVDSERVARNILEADCSEAWTTVKLMERRGRVALDSMEVAQRAPGPVAGKSRELPHPRFKGTPKHALQKLVQPPPKPLRSPPKVPEDASTRADVPIDAAATVFPNGTFSTFAETHSIPAMQHDIPESDRYQRDASAVDLPRRHIFRVSALPHDENQLAHSRGGAEQLRDIEKSLADRTAQMSRRTLQLGL